MPNITAPAAATLPQYENGRTTKFTTDTWARTSQVSHLGGARIDRVSHDDGHTQVEITVRDIELPLVTLHSRDDREDYVLLDFTTGPAHGCRTSTRNTMDLEQARKLRDRLNALDLG